MIAEITSELLENKNFKDLTRFLNISHLGLMQNINQVKQTINGSSINDLCIFSRLTIKEGKGVNANNIKKIFSENRFKYDIIAVEPVSASVAAIAARDRRVDVVRIGNESTLKVFNTRYGRRLEEFNKFVEIDLSLFWQKKLAKNLRPLMRVLRSLKSCKLNYILHKDIVELHDLRSYRGLQSIGRLLNLSNENTGKPDLIERIELNEKKRDGRIPMDGVEITEW